MKLSTSLLVLAMAGTSLAQAPAPKTTTPAKPAAAQAAPATATAKPTLPATSPSAKPAKSAVKTTAKPMAAVKPAPKAEKPKEVKKEAAPAAAAPAVEEAKKEAGEKPAPEMKRGRDPFVSVIMTRETTGAPCAGTGKKCLIIDQVMLKGIVRSQVGPIAVVTSSSNKTYFLRENDPVYNGVVVKITPDSIVFRETVTDRLGKSIQRDVVKKVNNPAA